MNRDKLSPAMLVVIVFLALWILLMLPGCSGSWETREGWVNEGDPAAVVPGVDGVFQAARDLAPCRIEPWGGWVTWYGEPFDCGGILAAGCFTGASDRSARIEVVGLPRFGVARRTALAHELGHYVNARCSGDYSEAAAISFAAAVEARLP